MIKTELNLQSTNLNIDEAVKFNILNGESPVVCGLRRTALNFCYGN